MSVAAPTIEASLDGRFISGLKDERMKAAKYYEKRGLKEPSQLVSCQHICLTWPEFQKLHCICMHDVFCVMITANMIATAVIIAPAALHAAASVCTLPLKPEHASEWQSCACWCGIAHATLLN